MHIAQVTSWGETPRYTTVPDNATPEGHVRVKIEAAGVPRVVRVRAAGNHYSAKSLPYVPGIDGVGRTPDGQLVYFTSFSTDKTGSFSDHIDVPRQDIHPLREDDDPAQIAALANPASSSWLAFKSRTDLPKDFSVLIIGATTASGRIAISLARALGAKRIIGAARSKIDNVDESITLAGAETDFSSLGDVDVVLDYIYGPVTEQLFRSLKSTTPVQYVQIGNLGGSTINMPGDILRSKNLTIRGSGPGSWSFKDAAHSLPELLKTLSTVRTSVKKVPLRDIEKEWNAEGSDRLVFVP